MVANPALTGFTAPKILWLRNNEPKNFAKVAKVLLPKDEIRRRLTGEFATEVSDASGMLILPALGIVTLAGSFGNLAQRSVEVRRDPPGPQPQRGVLGPRA